MGEQRGGDFGAQKHTAVVMWMQELGVRLSALAPRYCLCSTHFPSLFVDLRRLCLDLSALSIPFHGRSLMPSAARAPEKPSTVRSQASFVRSRIAVRLLHASPLPRASEPPSFALPVMRYVLRLELSVRVVRAGLQFAHSQLVNVLIALPQFDFAAAK